MCDSPPGARAELRGKTTRRLMGLSTTVNSGESSYATSLASSVVDYPYEHGRRYHAFRAGRKSPFTTLGL